MIGTLRRAEPERLRRWHLLAALGGLVLLRALFYWQIGAVAHWTGTLNLGVISLSFRSDYFDRMLALFRFQFRPGARRFVSLPVAALHPGRAGTFHRLVRMPLGRIDRWSRKAKFLLPLIVLAVFWWLASWLLVDLEIIPKPVATRQRFEESLLIGLGGYLTWKYVAGALLTLHLLNSYIYFGKNPFWVNVNAEAQTLLSPLRAFPLRAGKLDFAPVVGIALVFMGAELAGWGLVWLYGRLPL